MFGDFHGVPLFLTMVLSSLQEEREWDKKKIL